MIAASAIGVLVVDETHPASDRGDQAGWSRD